MNKSKKLLILSRGNCYIRILWLQLTETHLEKSGGKEEGTLAHIKHIVLAKVGRDGARNSNGLRILFPSRSPQVDFVLSEELSPEVGSRAASYSGLTSSQFCGQKEQDCISSPSLLGKNFDWPASVKYRMADCPISLGLRRFPEMWDFQF